MREWLNVRDRWKKVESEGIASCEVCHKQWEEKYLAKQQNSNPERYLRTTLLHSTKDVKCRVIAMIY